MGTGLINKTKRQAQQGGNQAAREAAPWIERLARLGYAARGVVYLVIGMIALQAANGAGSPNVDQQRALYAILSQPFGQVLLTIITIGLLGYALWRLFEAVVDPEHEGADGHGVAKRVGYAIAGLSYGALAYFAWRVLRGTQTGSANAQDMTAQVMARPFGHWLIALIGLALALAGLYQIYQAYAWKFEMRFKSGEMSGAQHQAAIRLGRAGFATKGVVYIIIGVFLMQAGLTFDPQKAGGLGKALQTLASQPYGAWVLALTALGLLAYGLYSLALALFRQIQIR
jgi:hypothetical protein